VIRWRKALGVSRIHRDGRYYPAELISLDGQTPFAIVDKEPAAAAPAAAKPVPRTARAKPTSRAVIQSSSKGA
jgi:hypothetical protein